MIDALHHIALQPKNHGAGPHPTLLLIHGRGADEEDLPGLADRLDPRLLILSVRAPFPFSPGGGYTWYDVGEGGSPEPAMFRESCERLSRFVDQALQQYPVDPARLFLLGFSMGTVMALALSLSRPGLVRGVSANSGYVAEGTHLVYRWTDLAGTSFFLAHGTFDPVIPIALARRARDLFSASNAPHMFREYPMAHQITDESLADIAAWLHPLVGAAERTDPWPSTP
jgi:phospholipase/carboxylesterase